MSDPAKSEVVEMSRGDAGRRGSVVLNLHDLSVSVRGSGHPILCKVSLSLGSGDVLGVVGESGSGKSTLVRAIMGLLSPDLRVTGGSIEAHGEAILSPGMDVRAHLRGREASMIFQNATGSLDPLFRIGEQIDELLRGQGVARRPERFRQSTLLLGSVGLTAPQRVLRQFPFQLSGGMNQRVAIGLALVSRPRVLFADEATSALDVTTQAEVVSLLRRAVEDHLDAMVFVTHDILLASDLCNRIVVMKSGEVVEEGLTQDVLRHPREAYTRSLIDAVPGVSFKRGPGTTPTPGSLEPIAPLGAELSQTAPERPAERRQARDDASKNILRLDSISVVFEGDRGKENQAVADVSLSVDDRQCVGIVGESGSGKSTLARVVLGLTAPSAGRRELFGDSVEPRVKDARIQAVFQDAFASLDPMQRIGAGFRELRALLPAEPAPYTDDELLGMVGLGGDVLSKRPRQLSGGQCQRVAIGRALLFRPRLLVADEPTSALDVRVQAQILGLLKDLNQRHNMSMLFISHNLLVVRELCSYVHVMRRGEVVESGPTDIVLSSPKHEYTAKLIVSIPGQDFILPR